MSGYWGAENLSSAFLERRMHERCGNMQREREIVTPSVSVAEECKKSGVSLTELRSGSRRGRLPAVRTKIVCGLVENYRVGVVEIARPPGFRRS